MLEVFTRLNASLNKWVEYLLSALGIVMAMTVSAQVVSRYLLNHSLFWSEELARYLLVWLTFLGASAAYYRKAHPGIDLLSSRMGPRLRRVNTIIIHLVSLGLFLVMIYHGTAFSAFVRAQISPALSLPMWVVFAIIPVSGLLLSCHCLYFLTREIQGSDHDR
jgi:TRAP-type C4-dicarboxylate transport system permease small subunit